MLNPICERLHEPTEMYWVPTKMAYFCPAPGCGEALTKAAILMLVPPEYKPSTNEMVSALQLMANYEIQARITDDGIFIEYPRRHYSNPNLRPGPTPAQATRPSKDT